MTTPKPSKIPVPKVPKAKSPQAKPATWEDWREAADADMDKTIEELADVSDRLGKVEKAQETQVANFMSAINTLSREVMEATAKAIVTGVKEQFQTEYKTTEHLILKAVLGAVRPEIGQRLADLEKKITASFKAEGKAIEERLWQRNLDEKARMRAAFDAEDPQPPPVVAAVVPTTTQPTDEGKGVEGKTTSGVEKQPGQERPSVVESSIVYLSKVGLLGRLPTHKEYLALDGSPDSMKLEKELADLKMTDPVSYWRWFIVIQDEDEHDVGEDTLKALRAGLQQLVDEFKNPATSPNRQKFVKRRHGELAALIKEFKLSADL